MVLFIFFLYHILSFLFTPLYKCIQYICVYKQKMMLTNQLSCRERERESLDPKAVRSDLGTRLRKRVRQLQRWLIFGLDF